jgi:anaphase-promoting complex subunit 1
MAGTGDLPLLTKLQKLHERLGVDVSYGSHMACNMAIGLLFAGGGRYSLSTSNTAIVGLVACLYPRYPASPTDNQCHLQVLRHFWVLAFEPRCLITRDVESRQACPLPVIVSVRRQGHRSEDANVETFEMTTPCILPTLSTIEKIQVNSNRYWSMTLNLRGNEKHRASFVKSQTLFVKRKAGHLNYLKVDTVLGFQL